MRTRNRSFLTLVALASGMGLLGSAPALAYTHLGGEFTVTGTLVDANTATFVYTADFTNWTGSSDFIFAVDLGIGGPKVKSIDAFSTTAGGGTWVYGFGPTNAGGCQGTSAIFACAEDDPFSTADGQRTTGVVTWTFTVTFDNDPDKDPLTSAFWTDSNNHIGAFFMDCGTYDGTAWSDECTGKEGLSEEITFGDTDTDTDVPEPGSLALLGLGLLGLGLARRRA